MTSTPHDAPPPDDGADIDVTVIGGYLGAGKTTLVNHILRTADEKIAVLVNDFGDINIDEELIASQDGDTISLANGCICCSLIDGFSSALATINALDPRPERLVIESSGVADPATVAAYGHGPGLTLDATIVVVDAETIRTKSRDVYVGDTVIGQLRSGDIIVLNKIDLVSVDDVETTRRWLSETAPHAVVVDAVNAMVDPAVLFGVVPPQPRSQLESGDHQPADAGHADHGHADHQPADAGHADHGHAEGLFESVTWRTSNPVDRASIEELMELLPDQVVRAKGVLRLREDPDQPMVLQRVGKRWTLRRFAGSATPGSRLVLIGLRGALATVVLDEVLAPTS